MIATKNFRPFRRRIKFLLAFEGVCSGLAVGTLIGVVWAILDWRGVVYFEWAQFAMLMVVSAAIGAMVRLFKKVDDLAIARSIDRRAKLKDRLGTSAELHADESAFTELLAVDAAQHLTALQPKALYPVRLKRFHLLALVGIALVATIVFLANTKIFLPKEALAEKASMQKESKRLEELRKAIFDDGSEKKTTTPELMALQKDLLRLQKDYEKARIDPKEAMIKAEELAKKADELAKKSAVQELDKIKNSETMLEKMEKEALQKAGLEKADMSDVQMSDSDFDQKMDAAQQKSEGAGNKADELQKKLDALKSQMNKPGMDENAKKDLEKQIEQTKKDLEQALKDAEQAKKDMESLMLSKEARDTLKKIFDDPMWKQIQEAAKKLKQSASQAAKTGQPKLTKEQLEEMRKKMEEFLKQMEDEDFRKEYLKKLLESMKDGASQCQCAGLGLGLGLGMGMSQNGSSGPGPDNDVMVADTGHVNLQKPEQGKGKGNPVFAPTERDSSRPGMEMTFEIKAPTFKGTRTSVPYKNVLPSYTKKAESALNRNEIPKEHQQRVKRYFESLKK